MGIRLRTLSLKQFRDLMRQVEDGHVMLQIFAGGPPWKKAQAEARHVTREARSPLLDFTFKLSPQNRQRTSNRSQNRNGSFGARRGSSLVPLKNRVFTTPDG